MKNGWNKNYTVIAIYAFAVIAAAVLFLICILGARDFFVEGKYSDIVKIFSPIIYGIVIAYVMNPVMMFCERKIYHKVGLKKNTAKSASLRRMLAVFSSGIIALIVVALLVLTVTPQIGVSMRSLAASIADLFSPADAPPRSEVNNGTDSAENSGIEDELFGDLLGDQEYIPINPSSLSDTKIAKYINDIAVSLQDFVDGLGLNINVQSTAQDSITDMIAYLANFTAQYSQSFINWTVDFLYSIFSEILNITIGIIVSIYILMTKERLTAQIKKVMFGIFNKKAVFRILQVSRRTHSTIGGYINATLLDSLIVGVINFICMSAFGIQYPMLISVIVAVTNIIPFFGPFIGAIPSMFILVINEPWQALWFGVFILILQQIDGNILKPKLLGQSTGLSSFWIIFSITVMSGLFGIFGMFIGVPIFTVLYELFKEFIENRLKNRNMAYETVFYELPIIDSGSQNDRDTPKGIDFNALVSGTVKKITDRFHKKDTSGLPETPAESEPDNNESGTEES